MNFDIWFSERAEGLKWRALTEKYLKQPLKLNNILRTKILEWNSLQPHGEPFVI